MRVHKTNGPADGDSGWLTTAEAAELIPGATYRAVHGWCKAGKIPGAIQLPNRRWMIPVSAVREIVDPTGDGEVG